MLICCAGIFDGSRVKDEVERTEDAIRLIETNLTGPVVAATAMAERMKSRSTGHIVLISSLAALIPQADAAAYSATKAGLTAYGAALRELLHPAGIRVTVVHPGHVATAQTAQQVGPLPILMTPEAAVRRILRGLKSRKAQITFPRLLAIYARIYALMPFPLKRLANAGVRFVVRDPVE